MLECEGYKMFYGTATVTPVNPKFPARDITGTWLYKPEHDCWYVNGESWPAEIVSDIREEQGADDRKWISTDDDYPENQSIVLVYSTYGGMGFALFDGYHGPKFIPAPRVSQIDFVTHWMPLPTRPEGT